MTGAGAGSEAGAGAGNGLGPGQGLEWGPGMGLGARLGQECVLVRFVSDWSEEFMLYCFRYRYSRVKYTKYGLIHKSRISLRQ